MRRVMWKKATVVALVFAMVVTSALADNSFSVAAVKAKKITLSTKRKTLYTGEILELSVKKVTPSKAKKTVSWKSSNKKVATVTKKGVVKAVWNKKKSAKATITATSKTNKKVKATCKITVKKGVPNKSIKLNQSNATIDLGGSVKLSVKTWNPKTTKVKKVKWSTSNKKVATVSNGTVKGIGVGNARITATNTYGKKATCNVTVKSAVTPSPVTPTPVTPSPVTPTPVTPSPVTPTPVTPTPVTPDPGTPDPVTPDPGTPDPGTPDPVTPDPGTPDPGTPDPGTPDPGFTAPPYPENTYYPVAPEEVGETLVYSIPADADYKLVSEDASFKLLGYTITDADVILSSKLIDTIEKYQELGIEDTYNRWCDLSYIGSDTYLDWLGLNDQYVMVEFVNADGDDSGQKKYINIETDKGIVIESYSMEFKPSGDDAYAITIFKGEGNDETEVLTATLLKDEVTGDMEVVAEFRNIAYAATLSADGTTIAIEKAGEEIIKLVKDGENDVVLTLAKSFVDTYKAQVWSTEESSSVDPSDDPGTTEDPSSSSLIFYENFDDQNSSLYEENNPDGPILISGMSNGEAIPRIAPSNNAAGLTSNNKVGRPDNSSYAARIPSYNSNDYIQVAVKNTSATKQTYLFAFCVRYHTRSNTGISNTVPLQVVSFNTKTPDNTTVLKTQTITLGTTDAFWNDFIVPVVDVPANETVNIRINQTTDFGTNNVRLCFDDFYLWSVNGGDPHNSANYTLPLETGNKGKIDISLGEGETVTWLSNDTSIATVDEEGEVTAVAAGQTFVIAEIKKDDVIVDKKVCIIEVK